MYYIKLNGATMELSSTKREAIHRGDNLSRKITFLLPKLVGEIDPAEATVYMCYLRPDNIPDDVLLTKEDELYRDEYYQFVFTVNADITKRPGEVCIWLHMFSGSGDETINEKSGECMLNILESKDLDDYIDADEHDTYIASVYEASQSNGDTGDDGDGDDDDDSECTGIATSEELSEMMDDTLG